MKPSNARTSGKGGVSFTRVEDYWVIVEEGCWVANIWRVSAGYERARVVQSIWWDVRVTEPPAKFYKFLLGRFNPTFSKDSCVLLEHVLCKHVQDTHISI